MFIRLIEITQVIAVIVGQWFFQTRCNISIFDSVGDKLDGNEGCGKVGDLRGILIVEGDLDGTEGKLDILGATMELALEIAVQSFLI